MIVQEAKIMFSSMRNTNYWMTPAKTVEEKGVKATKGPET